MEGCETSHITYFKIQGNPKEKRTDLKGTERHADIGGEREVVHITHLEVRGEGARRDRVVVAAGIHTKIVWLWLSGQVLQASRLAQHKPILRRDRAVVAAGTHTGILCLWLSGQAQETSCCPAGEIVRKDSEIVTAERTQMQYGCIYMARCTCKTSVVVADWPGTPGLSTLPSTRQSSGEMMYECSTAVPKERLKRFAIAVASEACRYLECNRFLCVLTFKD
eukprot:1160099-Pelagomonas_calceolata.AAC.3